MQGPVFGAVFYAKWYRTNNFAKKCDSGQWCGKNDKKCDNGAVKIQRFNNMYNSAVFSLCDIMI